MSQIFIREYLNDLEQVKRVSGSITEGVTRRAFSHLLMKLAKGHDLILIEEYKIETGKRTHIKLDGAFVHDIRTPFGYWEAKDEDDDLDEEIAKKFLKGYPQDNIIFEDTKEAVLIQNGVQVLRCMMLDTKALETLLNDFFAYTRIEYTNFRQAVEQFAKDLPAVIVTLRAMINEASTSRPDFPKAELKFLKIARETINPSVTPEDVREMLIQHILTEEIFNSVFNEADFHRKNNIAKNLYELEETFFVGAVKKQTLKSLEPYYAAIRGAAAEINNHTEKQKFLKSIYERFYQVYNPKAADRLGVVYTPTEIVRFMIEGADFLTQKHFGKGLIDEGVELLDPATGTGTFICELIDAFQGQREKLAHKYKHEMHANEVAILPYYVANLNIEATYFALTGQYAEFENLCFVDTLDNVAGLGKFSGHTDDLFGSISDENIARIKKQNARKISVIIGNPPYNAWQDNFNQRNANRPYVKIDGRIKDTYVKQGTAQNKISNYDMYLRFIRWASDRLRDEGVLCLITNRSFVDSKSLDGFRKTVLTDFQECHIVDLEGDWKKKGVGGGSNVFGIATGVAISFFIRKKPSVHDQGGSCRIFYTALPEGMKLDEKLAFLNNSRLSELKSTLIKPDKNNTWLEQTDNDFESLLPVANDETRNAKAPSQERAIFKLYSRGVATQRDDWVYDKSKTTLTAKMRFFAAHYEKVRAGVAMSQAERDVIKWDRELEKYLVRGIEKQFEEKAIIESLYRPFTKEYLYFDKHFNGMTYQLPKMFGATGLLENPAFTIMGDTTGKPYFCLAIKTLPDLNFVSPASGGTQTFSQFRFSPTGERLDNITDWALREFEAAYPSLRGGEADAAIQKKDWIASSQNAPRNDEHSITKPRIFAYVYAVLHNPLYRDKYALNLKREFPRIPFYADFNLWANLGEKLLALHIDYETVDQYPLTRLDVPDERAIKAKLTPKVYLKADKENGIITLDSETTLSNIPPSAFEYRLGNRSAIEWLLDQYKEKKPKDPTIAAKFNTYRFADYKEQVIDLLMRVVTVSVETLKITNEMKKI